MANWEVFSTLPQRHRPNALWFQAGVGLAFGQHQSLKELLDSDVLKSRSTLEAVIMRSEDTFRTWSKVYSGSGEFLSVSAPTPEMMYALGVTYNAEGDKHSFLVSSLDQGAHWNPVGNPPIAAIGVAFYAPKAGFAWSVERVYFTEDGGTSWAGVEFPLQLLEGFPPPVLDRHGTLWMAGKNELRSIHKTTMRTAMPIPQGLRAELLTLAPDGTPWLAGYRINEEGKRGSLELWTLSTHGKFSQVARFPGHLPTHLHIGQSSIFLIASKLDDVPPMRELNVSTDGGRSWSLEKPAVARGIGAVFFGDDETIWTSASADRLQRRRPG